LLTEWNRLVLRQILEKNQAVSASRTANEQKIGGLLRNLHRSGGLKADDLAAIQPLLQRIDSIHEKREIARLLAALHSSFGRAWEGGDNQTNTALFGYGPQADLQRCQPRVAGVDQGGLGMPAAITTWTATRRPRRFAEKICDPD